MLKEIYFLFILYVSSKTLSFLWFERKLFIYFYMQLQMYLCLEIFRLLYVHDTEQNKTENSLPSLKRGIINWTHKVHKRSKLYGTGHYDCRGYLVYGNSCTFSYIFLFLNSFIIERIEEQLSLTKSSTTI